MAKSSSYSNATLSVVLSFLDTEGIGQERVVAMYYDGTNHIAIYTVDQ